MSRCFAQRSVAIRARLPVEGAGTAAGEGLGTRGL
jgi:hypothetical protein